MKKEVVAYKRPNETIAYTFQKLGTNLEYMNLSKNFKTLLITSSTVPNFAIFPSTRAQI